MKKILFLMSGSIALYKMMHVLSALKKSTMDIKVVMSSSAKAFVGTATIEGLIGEPPLTDLFASSQAMDHIHWMRWADVIVWAPATANAINKMAHGIGDDVLSTFFLAHDFKKPFLVVPAMNTSMYQHPTTQAALKQLTSWGIHCLLPEEGSLACGESGLGRLPEPETILSAIALLVSPRLQGKKILITAGGTSEPIDDVRVISNHSTGKTGAYLADYFAMRGAQVVFVHATRCVMPKFATTCLSFSTFESLQLLLQEQFNASWDMIIHAAAVSDYRVEKSPGKIASKADTITLTLHKNPKLISQMKAFNPKAKLVGFKLTSGGDVKSQVKQLFDMAQCDFVVHNDWHAMQHQHVYHLFDSSFSLLADLSLEALAAQLELVF